MNILIMENIMSRRIFMTKEQIEFLKELESIQYYCVNVALCKKEKFSNIEEFLNDVTSEVIYRVMEMLDGYGEHLPKCNIVNTITGEIINDGIQLHDACVEFLENNHINKN
jgi:hypothetical protein